MPGAGLTADAFGKARPDRLAFKPYRGKLAVRNFRGGDGNVGIIRSPVRAIALPDLSARRVTQRKVEQQNACWTGYFARFHTISNVNPASVRGFVNFISSAVMDVMIRR